MHSHSLYPVKHPLTYLFRCSSGTGTRRFCTTAAPHQALLLHHPAKTEGCGGQSWEWVSSVPKAVPLSLETVLCCPSRGETLGTRSSSFTSATALQHLQSCFAHGDGMGEGHPHKRLLHRATLLLAERGGNRDAPRTTSNTTPFP